MENRNPSLPSEARGSIKEAIGKVTGDVHAEAEGAAEVKAARKRNCDSSDPSDIPEEPGRGMSSIDRRSNTNK